MKYRKFIEENFLIDEPKTGQLVPFSFNAVQDKYYNLLCKKYDIEKLGLSAPIRELIAKARREGFSSLILALFAADDILQENPTETQVVSYKDDATGTFRRRYRRYVLSWAAKKQGIGLDAVQADPNVLEKISKSVFAVDSTDLVLRHNMAHFYCGSAAARTGGRGGVLQKLLFSEAAHYIDTENMTAAESIEGTMRQIDLASGWIFLESTGNGKGNHFYKMWKMATEGLSRFIKRFFGWQDMYTKEQFATIASEFADADMLKQEYPADEDEAFLSSGMAFTTSEKLLALVGVVANKTLEVHLEMGGVNYIDQAETIKDFAITFEKTHPNHKLYLGLDTAKHIDRTVLTILMEKDLSPAGGVRCIAIDSTGQGDFMPDWFERNTKWYVHRMTFSRPSKSIMYKNLQVVLQNKSTSLPVFLVGTKFASEEWHHFYDQMLNLQKEVIGSMLVIGHPPGQCTASGHDYNNCEHHDDFSDSWGLAELAYVTVNGVPTDQRPPEEGGNFDSRVRRLLDRKNNRGGGGIESFS